MDALAIVEVRLPALAQVLRHGDVVSLVQLKQAVPEPTNYPLGPGVPRSL